MKLATLCQIRSMAARNFCRNSYRNPSRADAWERIYDRYDAVVCKIKGGAL